MTVYLYSGMPLELTDAGSGDSGNLVAANCFNPVTGAQGPNVLKITNSSGGNLATLTYTFESETYSFANVSGTPSGSGANATFNVTVTNSGYTASINDAGDGFIATETVVIAGTDVGGASPANDVTITVDTVGNIGQITGISTAGTQIWPQGSQPTLIVGPGTTDFVQVATGVADSVFVTLSMADSANVVVAPVQIVG